MELFWALAEDLPRTWDHPAASAETRKRMLRAVLEEIIVTVEPAHLHLKLHWKGGEHPSLDVPKGLHGEHRWKTSVATEQLIHDLARLLAGCQYRRRSEPDERTVGKRTYLDPAAHSELPGRT